MWGPAPTLCKRHCMFNLLFLTQQQLWRKEPNRTSGIRGAATAGPTCSRDAEILLLQTWFCPGMVTATPEINSWKWSLCKCPLKRKFRLREKSCWNNFFGDTWLFLVISWNSSQLFCAAVELELFCSALQSFTDVYNACGQLLCNATKFPRELEFPILWTC